MGWWCGWQGGEDRPICVLCTRGAVDGDCLCLQALEFLFPNLKLKQSNGLTNWYKEGALLVAASSKPKTFCVDCSKLRVFEEVFYQ